MAPQNANNVSDSGVRRVSNKAEGPHAALVRIFVGLGLLRAPCPQISVDRVWHLRRIIAREAVVNQKLVDVLRF